MTGASLKAFRESKGLTQAKFAQLIGLKREKTISDYERGDLMVPEWLINLVSLMNSAKREVTMIDNGISPTSELLDYLDNHLIINRPGLDTVHIAKYTISEISNHKGNWRVCFDDVPGVSVLLCLFTFFETVQNWDGLSELVFCHDSLFEKRLTNVAGCLREDFGEKKAEAIAFAAAEAKRRFEQAQVAAIV